MTYAPFDKFVGKAPDGGYYRLLAFKEYNPESDTITVTAPFIFKCLNMAIEAAKGREPLKMNRLFRSSAGNENSAAIELANRILTGLLRRGANKGGVTKYSITYQALIDGCPQLKKELEYIETNTAKTDRYGQPVLDENGNQLQKTRREITNAINKKLSKRFNQAYKIITNKSDAFDYFIDLKFEPNNQKGELKPPTKSTLKEKITITFTGKNNNFKFE